MSEFDVNQIFRRRRKDASPFPPEIRSKYPMFLGGYIPAKQGALREESPETAHQRRIQIGHGDRQTQINQTGHTMIGDAAGHNSREM